jgi:hypothetical protein
MEKNQVPPQETYDQLFVYTPRLNQNKSLHIRGGVAFNHESQQRVDFPDLANYFCRGWTLQEGVLSSRKLWFLRDEIVWECTQLDDCECHGSVNSEVLSSGGSFLVAKNWLNSKFHDSSQKGLRFAMVLGHVGIERVMFKKRWTDPMRIYSTRKLTYTSDKLPAISGLGKRFGEVQAGQYLAGLWEAGLPLDLLWQPREIYPGYLRFRFSPSQLPTWSWSSYDGPVLFSTHYTDDFSWNGSFYVETEVLKASCIPNGSNTEGEVLSGTITLRGSLVALDVEHTEKVEENFVGLIMDTVESQELYHTTIDIPEGSGSEGTVGDVKLFVETPRTTPVKTCSKPIPSRLFMLIIYTPFVPETTATTLFDRMMKGTTTCQALCFKRSERDPLKFERYGLFALSKGEELGERFGRKLTDRATITTVVII